MVGDLSRPVSYKTMLYRLCLQAVLVWLVINEVNSSLCYELCVIAFKTSSVKTFVLWDLGMVAVSSHLWWLINNISNLSTTRMETCNLWEICQEANWFLKDLACLAEYCKVYFLTKSLIISHFLSIEYSNMQNDMPCMYLWW